MASRYTMDGAHRFYPKPAEKEINILLMGETGNGKTTFINAFMNYLLFTTVDDALNGTLEALIPSKFTIMNKETFAEENVIIGNLADANAECQNSAYSSTRLCHSYVFKVKNRLIRLIDVPGVGDTTNIDQDVLNLEHILSYISQYEYLNGICLFFKANETRATVYFRYCVKEVLRQLQVSAIKNILFVFTHSRSVNFEPGDSVKLVRELLKQIKDMNNIEVPFNRTNSFFMDNEAFRFVAACQQGLNHLMVQKADMGKSWQRSVNETYRMIDFIFKCDHHAVRDTCSLATAKQLMSQLARPIAEAVKLIEENKTLAQQYKLNMLGNLSGPQDGYSLPQLSFRVIELEKRLTVCIDTKCTRLVNVDGATKVDYYQHCHDGCHLKNVVQECIGHPILRQCAAMTKDGMCNNCGCEWHQHMHVTYELVKERKAVKIGDSGTTREPTSIMILIDRRITDLRKETEKIRELCVKLSAFIKKNSIIPFNDDILQYLDLALKEAKQTAGLGRTNEESIKNLENMIQLYKEEMKLHQDVPIQLDNDLYVNEVELKNFFAFAEELYKLPISGGAIKMQVDHIKQAAVNTISTQDRKAELPATNNGSALLEKLSRL